MSQHAIETPRPRELRAHFAALLPLPSFLVLTLLLMLLLVAYPAGPSHAAWSHGDWTEVFTSTTEIHELSVASDAAGGTLVMVLNQENFPSRSIISRLSRTGTELWGNEGKLIPFDPSVTNQVRPIAIAPDGNGGAYCALSEWYSVNAILRLSHFDANGVQTWSVNVADMGGNPGTAAAQLVFEPGIGITVGYVGSSIQHLIASRYDVAGNLMWTTSVNDYYEHNIQVGSGGGYTEYDMESDGTGGVLFAWYRYDPIEYMNFGTYSEQIGAQRIDIDGIPLWGVDGHTVWDQPGFWHSHAYHARIVDDAAGGAYVVTSGGLRAYGQHLNSDGVETWATNGIILQAASPTAWDQGTDPQLCRDGAYGMYLVQTNENVFAQHVDINGGLPWGVDGIVTANTSSTNESFDDARIDEDGYGGAVVGFHRWDDGVESLGGLRFDGFGTVLWEDESLFEATNGDEIVDIHVVSDDLGGAQYVWKRHVPYAPEKDDVYALGVNSQGQPPLPVLYGFAPDAAQPGETEAVWLFGDYLDTGYDYNLRRNQQTIHMTGAVAVNTGLIGGWYNFTGAAIGAWDLYATLDGIDKASLADAFGVGLPPSCQSEDLLASQMVAVSSGTRRKMSFDSQGTCRYGILNYDSIGNEMVVLRGLNNGSETSLTVLESIPGQTVTDLAYTTDSNGHDLVAYIGHGIGEDYLACHGFYESGSPLPWANDNFPPSSSSDPLSNPVIAALPGGSFHIVVEEGADGTKNLRDILVTETSTSDHIDPQSGANAHSADLAVTPDGMAMVYVRNSWIPGVSDLCLQYFRNGVWEVPQVVTFALSLESPTVAFDSQFGLLLGWILDNTGNGSGPVLQTCLVTNGVFGPIRTRATDGEIYRVQVDAQGPGNFYMLTQETGQPMQFFLRGGNGNVFYPKLRLNSVDDSDWPLFAAQHGGARLNAIWQSYNHPTYGNAIMGWFCNEGVTTDTGPATPTLHVAGVKAYPNPFNPRTTISFSLIEDQWVKLNIIDLHGRQVRTLLDGPLSAGNQQVLFDGRDDRGIPLASGTYFAQLRSSLGEPGVVKLTLLK